MQDQLNISVEGHVKIMSYADNDRSDPIELLSKRNAIHKEHMSIALARALAGEDSGHVYSMHFGSGGATIDQSGSITYSDPNVIGAADLNVPAYHEVVDSTRGAPDGNTVGSRHVVGLLYTDVEIRCVLDKSEPFGQPAFDNTVTTVEGDFVFDEIGLKTSDGLLMTHIVFAPITKSANRVIEVVYVLRIRIP